MSKPQMPVPQVSKPVVNNIKELSSEGGEIEVVANREGFYDCRRINEGDVFLISSMDKLGSWMTLTDSKLEAQRQAKRGK